MGPKLRLILGVLSFLLITGVLLTKVSADNGETYFVITAYYSPLPDQLKYTTGSYAGDIRLNGEGHTTASGNNVFPGLLAGPSNYPFGTKIYFEGYGIGVIEDRGGAIVEAGERGHSYDRIDIWMGYGDEGLTRALNWGTRTIKGKIVVPSSEVTINFGESQIGTLTKLSVNPENHNPEDVKLVQTIFTKANLYTGKIDGEYESIKNEIINFQLSTGIITGADDEAAGWYGPKTITALRQKYGNSNNNLVQESIDNFANYKNTVASEKYKTILDYGNLTVGPDSDSAEIRELQDLLTQLGEYGGSIDGNYSTVEKALLDLQIRIGLIENTNSWGAGYFGNQTKSALWNYYEFATDAVVYETETFNLSISERNTLDAAVLNLKQNYPVSLISTLKSQIIQLVDNDSYIKHKDKLIYLSTVL